MMCHPDQTFKDGPRVIRFILLKNQPISNHLVSDLTVFFGLFDSETTPCHWRLVPEMGQRRFTILTASGQEPAFRPRANAL